jgi:general secretion pathway protein G
MLNGWHTMKAQEKTDLLIHSDLPASNIRLAVPERFRDLPDNRGFTLLELMLVIAIVAILTAIFIPTFTQYLVLASSSRAMSDVRTIETAISAFIIDAHGDLPGGLADVGFANLVDPWENHYVYDPAGTRMKGLFPLDDDYDLYSKGPDTLTNPSIYANESLDDIIRGDNGNYVGVASNYGL